MTRCNHSGVAPNNSMVLYINEIDLPLHGSMHQPDEQRCEFLKCQVSCLPKDTQTTTDNIIMCILLDQKVPFSEEWNIGQISAVVKGNPQYDKGFVTSYLTNTICMFAIYYYTCNQQIPLSLLIVLQRTSLWPLLHTPPLI